MSLPASLPSPLPMLCLLSLAVLAVSSCTTDIVPISDPESTSSVTPSQPVLPSPSLSTSDLLPSHSLSHSELQRTPEPLVTEERPEFEPDIACVRSYPPRVTSTFPSPSTRLNFADVAHSSLARVHSSSIVFDHTYAFPLCLCFHRFSSRARLL
jgi:hypothetical protein